MYYLAANDGVPSTPGRYAVIGCKLKQNDNDGCNSCASLAGLVLTFIARFTCDRSFNGVVNPDDLSRVLA